MDKFALRIVVAYVIEQKTNKTKSTLFQSQISLKLFSETLQVHRMFLYAIIQVF